MIKKYYTLLIASESDHINKSIRLSTTPMVLLLSGILLILLLAIFGAAIFFGLDSRQGSVELKQMRVFRDEIVDIISNQKLLGTSDSLALRDIKKVIHTGATSSSMIAPIDGFVTQGLDVENNHNGIDIISYKGDHIKSALDGVVIFSGENKNLGNTLIVSHPYNYFTVYGHCDSLMVSERDLVKKEQIIATVGESGITTAPHLHFEVWYNNVIIDPREIIKKYGDVDVSTE